MSETYTVIMRGETFVLTRDQIEFDSPNYFTACFLGEFIESQTRTLTLSREPVLFRIILDHLSGYEVIPLHASVIPKRMSPEVALRNLLADAQFYLLDGLRREIGLSAQSPGPTPAIPPLVSYVMLIARDTNSWEPPVPISEDMAQSMRGKLSHSLMCKRTIDLTSVKTALLDASIPKPFAVDAALTVESTRFDQHYLILRLTG
ncbi:hypothetical protein FRC12_019294 [Ceratobasidium sp. 428]|nr:hypothetical protein FRC12_019294 [Ceratobasidium sp. 428]